MSDCPKCHQWMFSDLHQCNPMWECWDEDGDRGDSHDVRAMNAESAAEEYAEEWDRDERDLLRATASLTVYVVPKGSPADVVPEVFEVYGEVVAEYTAHKVETETDKPTTAT